MVEFLVLVGIAFVIGGCIALRQKWNKIQASRQAELESKKE